MRLVDITGMVFGCWRVIEYAGSSAWRCVCTSCSKSHCINGQSLKTQKHGICGDCWRRKTQKTHGHTTNAVKSKAYSVWQGMLNRCRNPNVPMYRRYGGRGIRVCKKWLRFENFFRDMGEPPLGLSLGRINNDGNYEPSNCRWETAVEQHNNIITNRFVKFHGQQMTCAQFARLVGAKRDHIYRMLDNAELPHHIIPTLVQVPYGKKQRFIPC